MFAKRKGTKAELELLHKFWENGFIAMRAPSSGVIKYPCPDLLVGNTIRKLAIECKSTGYRKRYVSSEQINNLKKFSQVFGAEPWVAVRFNKTKTSKEGNKEGWYFISIDDLRETKGNNYVITLELAQARGLLFEDIIRMQ
ncbi:MAG: Holliday junction resolvase Hjc [Candidatus Woesearchaeota archaeon]|nr:Holliday junction resolvase Hjc [Candidatus Woesearchaeota archaeon]